MKELSPSKTAANPDGEEGEEAPNHPSQKEIISVTESLEQLNNELQLFLRNAQEDQLVELKLEDVKEKKFEPSETSNVISMEGMYESTHIQEELDKMTKVRDSNQTPAKLKSLL